MDFVFVMFLATLVMFLATLGSLAGWAVLVSIFDNQSLAPSLIYWLFCGILGAAFVVARYNEPARYEVVGTYDVQTSDQDIDYIVHDERFINLNKLLGRDLRLGQKITVSREIRWCGTVRERQDDVFTVAAD